MSWDPWLIVGLWLAVLASFWLTIWLLLANFTQGVESRVVERFLRGLRALLSPLPLLWLAVFGTLLARAWHGAGEWPRLLEHSFSGSFSANIRAAEFPLHTGLEGALSVALLLAAVLFPPVHAALHSGGKSSSRAWLALFSIPFALSLWIASTEGPANAMNWLAYTR